MKITKWRLGAAIIAVLTLATTTAYANHVFTDVEDERFYAAAAEWAKDNGITTGCGDGTTFCPEDPVTRGENVTFAKRYDDNIVQPALEAVDGRLDALEGGGTASAGVTQAALDAVEAKVDANAAAVSALDAAVAPLVNSVGAFAGGNADVPLNGTATVYQTVTIMAPEDGVVLVTGTGTVDNFSGASELLARCSITEGTTLDFTALQLASAPVGGYQTITATRGYPVTAGASLTVNLVCDAFSGGGNIEDAAMTAIFAPA